MWGYLSEFWNAITEVGGTTIEWFQNIGNAVAGATGQLFYGTLHYLNDTWVFLGWIFSVLAQIVALFLLPLTFIFQFLKGFLSSVFAAPTDFTFTWSSEVLAVFEAIPYWSTISLVLGIGISIIALFAILNLFTNL
jgi:hypothetical protein